MGAVIHFDLEKNKLILNLKKNQIYCSAWGFIPLHDVVCTLQFKLGHRKTICYNGHQWVKIYRTGSRAFCCQQKNMWVYILMIILLKSLE